MTVRRYRSVLIVIAVLIAWGSLYPFHFTDSPDFRGFFGWPGLSDILLNLFLYVPIGFLAFHSLASGGTSNRLALGAAIGFGLSTAMEVLQAFDPPRDSSLSDILCARPLAGLHSCWYSGHFSSSIPSFRCFICV